VCGTGGNPGRGNPEELDLMRVEHPMALDPKLMASPEEAVHRVMDNQMGQVRSGLAPRMVRDLRIRVGPIRMAVRGMGRVRATENRAQTERQERPGRIRALTRHSSNSSAQSESQTTPPPTPYSMQ
jgi:hypothetical protein